MTYLSAACKSCQMSTNREPRGDSFALRQVLVARRHKEPALRAEARRATALGAEPS